MLGLQNMSDILAVTYCDIQYEKCISATADNLYAGKCKQAEFPVGGTVRVPQPSTPTELHHTAQLWLSSPTQSTVATLCQEQEHADGLLSYFHTVTYFVFAENTLLHHQLWF